jgi:DNA-binding XRE family transcriptional regulator
MTKSPAEQLAETIVRTRKHRKTSSKRKAVWNCLIRPERERLGLTLRETADAVGMTQAGLSVIELGSDPMLTTAFKLSAFYGKPINVLWEPLT